MRRLILAVILTQSISVSAFAEYRVFTLKIEDSRTGVSRTVNTTLDHIQYREYYPVQFTEVVTIQDTWMCRYYRSDLSQDLDQKYCPNPKSQTANRPRS